MQVGNCPRLEARMYRTFDWAYYGSIYNSDTQGPSGNYSNLYGSSSGVANGMSVGGLVDPAMDECNSIHRHTMQYYRSGDLDYFFAKNTGGSGFPNEETCYYVNCFQPYYPYQYPHEYLVKFWGY
jgi:hypothetical protein